MAIIQTVVISIISLLSAAYTQPQSSTPAGTYLPTSFGVKSMYKIPDPMIQVYNDIGFEVSIPDDDGIKLFGFHGSLNVPMNGMELGQFNEDVLQKSPITGRWTYVNKSIKLKPGDILYFWLYVYKHNMAYMKTQQKFIVNGFSSTNGVTNTVISQLHPEIHEMSAEVADIYRSLYHCQSIADNTLESLVIAQKEIERLQKAYTELKYAEDSRISEVYYHAIMLGGYLPNISSDKQLEYINYILRERLHLFGVEARDSFKQKDGTILFDLRTRNDKQRVLEAAQKYLQNENIFIRNVQVQTK